MEIQYPLWLNQELWQEYKIMRKKIKKPMTDYAEKIALDKLDKLRSEGNDTDDVLKESIFNCYQGLFPVKNKEPEKAMPISGAGFKPVTPEQSAGIKRTLKQYES